MIDYEDPIGEKLIIIFSNDDLELEETKQLQFEVVKKKDIEYIDEEKIDIIGLNKKKKNAKRAVKSLF